jgi:hypothetical protein
MELGLWSSVIIVVSFSFLVVAMDEWIVKPMRHRRWEKLAESGDKEYEELLRIARSAKVSEE